MRQVIFANQNGPGTSGSFKNPGDIPVTFTFFGSCWASDTNVMTSVNLLIDGEVKGTGYIFSNNNTVHRTFTPVSFTLNLDSSKAVPGEHKVTISAGPNTTIDENDYFTLVMDY